MALAGAVSSNWLVISQMLGQAGQFSQPGVGRALPQRCLGALLGCQLQGTPGAYLEELVVLLSVFLMHVNAVDPPGAKRVLELDQYRGDEGRALFRENFGHNADYSLGEALWACSNLFSDVRVRLSHKRIMLFTNEDDPHANDSAKAKLARTRAGDLRDTGHYFLF